VTSRVRGIEKKYQVAFRGGGKGEEGGCGKKKITDQQRAERAGSCGGKEGRSTKSTVERQAVEPRKKGVSKN